MPAKLFRVILPVNDIDKASTFYSRVLASPGKRVSNGRHYFDCGGTILACFDAKADGDDEAFTPNPDHLYFAVDELDATFKACQEAGATFATGDVHDAPAGKIATRPWGERSFYMSDPFGNRICFVDRSTVFTG